MARRSGILKNTLNEEEVKTQNEFSDTPEAQNRQEILATLLGVTPIGAGAAIAAKTASLLPKLYSAYRPGVAAKGSDLTLSKMKRAMRGQAQGTAAIESVFQYPKAYGAVAGEEEEDTADSPLNIPTAPRNVPGLDKVLRDQDTAAKLSRLSQSVNRKHGGMIALKDLNKSSSSSPKQSSSAGSKPRGVGAATRGFGKALKKQR